MVGLARTASRMAPTSGPARAAALAQKALARAEAPPRRDPVVAGVRHLEDPVPPVPPVAPPPVLVRFDGRPRPHGPGEAPPLGPRRCGEPRQGSGDRALAD